MSKKAKPRKPRSLTAYCTRIEVDEHGRAIAHSQLTDYTWKWGACLAPNLATAKKIHGWLGRYIEWREGQK